MTSEAALELLLLATAVAIAAVGAVTAWASVNIVKRLIGLLIAEIGAVLAAMCLGAPSAVAIAAIASAFASLLLGAAFAVRLQEAYHSIDADDIDDEDRRSEPAD